MSTTLDNTHNYGIEKIISLENNYELLKELQKQANITLDSNEEMVRRHAKYDMNLIPSINEVNKVLISNFLKDLHKNFMLMTFLEPLA